MKLGTQIGFRALEKTAAREAVQNYLLDNIKTPPRLVVNVLRDEIAPATFRELYPHAQSFIDAHPLPGCSPIIIGLIWEMYAKESLS